MIIFNYVYVKRHYYGERRSHESGSSLLASPLAENNRGLGAYQVLWQSVENAHFERQDIAEYLMS